MKVTNPCVYPVIEIIELRSKVSLKTLLIRNHIPRLANTQAKAPSKIPKNTISDKLFVLTLRIIGKYKENKLKNTMKNAFPDSYLSLLIFCKVSISNLIKSLNCCHTSFKVFKLN